MARRNSNKASQVSGSIILDVRDKSCNVLNTRWHKTAWRLIVSVPSRRNKLLKNYDDEKYINTIGNVNMLTKTMKILTNI